MILQVVDRKSAPVHMRYERIVSGMRLRTPGPADYTPLTLLKPAVACNIRAALAHCPEVPRKVPDHKLQTPAILCHLSTLTQAPAPRDSVSNDAKSGS